MPQWAGSSWYYPALYGPARRRGSRPSEDSLQVLDARSTGTTAAWSTQRCICCIPASGTSSSTTSASSRRKEPYAKRTSHGMILGAGGEKMTKSRGNVINPDDTIAEIGADAFRMYEMFMGAFDQAIPWSTEGARGCRRFIERRLAPAGYPRPPTRACATRWRRPVNAMIKKVSEDSERIEVQHRHRGDDVLRQRDLHPRRA